MKLINYSWEQRKLNELGKIETGNTPSTSISKYYCEEGLPWITPTDITSNLTTKTERTLSAEGAKVARVIPANSVLCTCIASIGKNTFSPVKCAFNQQINALTPNNNQDPYFMYTDSYHWSETMKKSAGGLTFQIVNKTEFSNILTNVPCKEEQVKIGSLFNSLDNLITLHQRKLKIFCSHRFFKPVLFCYSWEQRELWQLTIWDKKFNGVESYKQPRVIKYPYVLADVFSQIEDPNGDVRLLSTGTYVGYTTKEKAGANLCNGEIVAIPWGGVANIKYFSGFFVTADNRIATSNDKKVLSNRYLHWWMESNIDAIQKTYRGASIQHPSMNDVLSLVIQFPNINEQEQISNYLNNLDSLITLHQRKQLMEE